MYKGQSQFLDLMCVDDSADQPIRFRIRPEKYLQYGKNIAEGTPTGSLVPHQRMEAQRNRPCSCEGRQRILTEREKAKLAAQAEKDSEEGNGDE